MKPMVQARARPPCRKSRLDPVNQYHQRLGVSRRVSDRAATRPRKRKPPAPPAVPNGCMTHTSEGDGVRKAAHPEDAPDSSPGGCHAPASAGGVLAVPPSVAIRLQTRRTHVAQTACSRCALQSTDGFIAPGEVNRGLPPRAALRACGPRLVGISAHAHINRRRDHSARRVLERPPSGAVPIPGSIRTSP